ncbi:hypothetical protein F1737_10965 [Methanoplanus sp. FWC-SCC4]|uniref:DUF4388 domain-containing protein n=1 Tax=Methanochimaera problematica TaxID=2609417 RepID=A0AA97FEN9_9EURY|nr:hypothetical protein [Methanoplanus sp. FWC-SCC4]WOF17162.1 hypothetical protein F1737_10965 [Methanoplanus sp. FWC-SCC4]
MQLPRGRFERFIRDGNIEAIFSEIKEKQFSGLCSGIFGDLEGELIFSKGRVILAEALGKSGDEALFLILKNPKGAVTAEQSGYTEAQIKLSMEFNPGFKTSEESDKPPASSDYSTKIKPEIIVQKAAPETYQRRESPLKPKFPEPFERLPEKSDTEETDNLKDDSLILAMSLEEIKSIEDNFRSNAKELLRKIHLEHLIEEKLQEEENK